MALELLVMVPTVSPAPVIALVAAACVWFTTMGTRTDDDPVETTISTLVPAATSEPACGLWLMTSPIGTVACDAVSTAPNVSPAVVIALPAAASVKLITLGTTASATTRSTAVPAVTGVPAAGV